MKEKIVFFCYINNKSYNELFSYLFFKKSLMKNFKKSSLIIILSILLVFGFIIWTMTFAAGPTLVDLWSSKSFAILSKTAITNVPSSVINGDIWASPITGAAIGLTCPEVTWTIYAVDATGPLPCRITNAWLLTIAVIDMEAAYNDAAGRATPTEIELNAWDIGWLTISPGLYKWSTDVNIATDITLSGNANDVWIFQISWDLTIASAQKVILSGWANASNVFWQVGWPTGATLWTNSTFNWTILSAKQVILQTNAVLNWRALAQTQVTLDQNTINIPTPVVEEEEVVVETTSMVEEEVIIDSTPVVEEEEEIITPTPIIEEEEEEIITPITPGFPKAGFQK